MGVPNHRDYITPPSPAIGILRTEEQHRHHCKGQVSYPRIPRELRPGISPASLHLGIAARFLTRLTLSMVSKSSGFTPQCSFGFICALPKPMSITHVIKNCAAFDA